MEQVVEIILAWPAIVQGALGSGLFWLILLLGQKSSSVSTSKYLRFSNKQRLDQANQVGLKTVFCFRSSTF
jgi:hypothetical protein